MIDPNKTIYEVYLVAVNPKEKIILDGTREEDIKRIILEKKYTILKRIMIQKAEPKDTFKEIITGKEYETTIVYTKNEYRKYLPWNFTNKKMKSSIFITPIFYKNLDTPFSTFNRTNLIYDSFLSKTTYENLKKYLEEHEDKETYLQELNELSKKAEDYYQELKKESNETDETKIKKLIKEYNSKNN